MLFIARDLELQSFMKNEKRTALLRGGREIPLVAVGSPFSSSQQLVYQVCWLSFSQTENRELIVSQRLVLSAIRLI